MCVAQLGIVKKPGEKKALVDFSGIEIEVRSGLVDVKEGDNVLVVCLSGGIHEARQLFE